MTKVIGLKLAALYSYSPCRLGFCGVRGKNAPKILFDFISGKKIQSQTIVKKVLEKFEASYPYYQLIAQSNNIADPFDYKVVEAYWLGNNLLERVKVKDLKELILNEFSKPGLLTKKQAERKASLIPEDAKPHHSFHVLFMGSVTGRITLTGKLVDVCRVGWGKVTKSKIKYSPLLVKNKEFFLGPPIEKNIVWDKRFLPKVKVDDVVSFHWERVCQVLTKNQQKNLIKYTKLSLQLLSEQHR